MDNGQFNHHHNHHLHHHHDRRHRITAYEDLFDSISENKRIEVGLHSVIAMGDKVSPDIRAMAEAVLEEIEFFRQRKRGVYYVPQRGKISEQNDHVVPMSGGNNKVCDPVVLECCQAVLEEMRYVRNEREMQRRCGYIALPFFIVFALMVIAGMIFGFTQMMRHA